MSVARERRPRHVNGELNGHHMMLLLRLLLLSCIAIVASAATAAPRVLVTIPPIHALAMNIMGGVATPELLLRGPVSPHEYRLRPSDARKLYNADVIITVGPPLEWFLDRALKNLGRDVVVIRLLDDKQLLRLRRQGKDDHRDQKSTDENQDATINDINELDPHIWLDPRNAIRIATVIAETLAAKDPANAARYARNRAQIIERLLRLDRELDARLKPLGSHAYLVYHDAFRYLQERYGLRAPEVVTASPDRAPGARRLRELRQTITEADIRCAFREPQFQSPAIDQLLRDAQVRVETLDPLGSTLASGANAYFQLMWKLAGTITDCLQQR